MPFRAAILDLDGTVYRGDEPIPGAVEGVQALRDAGLDLVFVSNNPTRTPASFARKLGSMGVEASPEEILTSGTVTVAYLAEAHPDAPIFVVGESGLREQFRTAGLELTAEPTRAEVVVVSYDRGFDYEKLTDALHALADGDAAFVGTDPDRVIPAADGTVVPGSGAIVGSVAATTDREPDRVLGKPDPFTTERVLDRLGVRGEDCLLVGDRLDTDVEMGRRTGATTVLVLTGVSDRDDAANARRPPDHVIASLADVESLLDGM